MLVSQDNHHIEHKFGFSNPLAKVFLTRLGSPLGSNINVIRTSQLALNNRHANVLAPLNNTAIYPKPDHLNLLYNTLCPTK